MSTEKPQNDLPVYLFRQGTNYQAHTFFGCHFDQLSEYAVFRIWAPSARAVSVLGDWNEWKEDANPMRRISEDGVWEAAINGVQAWQCYKFSILEADNTRRQQVDPFAFYAETEGEMASIVYHLENYIWQDSAWMSRRRRRVAHDRPMNVYELHMGSWRRHADGRMLSYIELADRLVPYLAQMGYTHLEMLTVMEHPADRSWSNRISSYFAASSRYGTPHELMTLIDRCHRAGIGVILDWTLSRYHQDAEGLEEFNLYRTESDGGYHLPAQQEWGSRRFHFGSTELHSFLISSARFWIETYHVDGLRIDALESMIHTDDSGGDEEDGWTREAGDSRTNAEASAFFQKLNRVIAESCPGVVMIAEGDASLAMVTRPVQESGLGFHYMWNRNWKNDILDYVSVDPIYRNMIHDKITTSINYSFGEHFILPISHEEATHGKRSLLDKMPGEYEWKFAGLRAFLGFMTACPGKKLNFMGYEIGQFSEWDPATQIEWFLLEYPAHKQMQNYVRALNRFYRETPALWENDHSWDGFRWISADDNTQNIVIFQRMDHQGNALTVLQNFAPVTREGYRFGVPEEGEYEEVFNSDRIEFGGGGHENGVLFTEEDPMHGFSCSLRVTAPPLSTIFIRRLTRSNPPAL
ncbi:MAG: 1,4-alpha-glucan branching protein GlgB [Clostridiales bacterium]|nr:1,4-alpha-glucan branching protein GlgB [Clostridiales bacterium]